MASNAGRTGRPAGDGGNREKILDAARHEFSVNGFRTTTLRAIAARAGVDVALLSHYFGNKDGLFVATLSLPEGAKEIAARALSGPLETQGERLTRGYLGLWEDPATSAQMQVLARSALSNEDAATRMRAMLTGAAANFEDADLLGGRRTGFTLAMSHLIGVAFGRDLTPNPGLTELDIDVLVARIAPAVQLHLSTVDSAKSSTA